MTQQYPAAVLEASRDVGSTHSTAASGTSTPALNVADLETQLVTLGFRPAHITSCLSALQAAHARLHSSSSSTNDPLVLSLSILSPLEASIEWLLLHLPEDDLPPRYRPSSSSADFITGASVSQGGQNALVKGWLVDKLVKKAGFPRKAVEEVLSTESRESAALDLLGRRLCGWESGEDGWGTTEYGPGWSGDDMASEERQITRDEEILALEAVLGERFHRPSPTEVAVDIEDESGKDAIGLHILFDESSPYPSSQYPTHAPAFYITSPTLPSYMRLHLHSSLLRQFRDPERHDLRGMLESGAGGVVLTMVEYLETALPEVIASPPDIGQVTQHLVPKVPEEVRASRGPAAARGPKKSREGMKRRIPTQEEEEAVRKKREIMRDRPEYAKMMEERSRLPAWKERDRITSALDTNRVLVVVGEVSGLVFLYHPRLGLGRADAAKRPVAARVPNCLNSSWTTRSTLVAALPPTSSSPSRVEWQLWAWPLVLPKNDWRTWTGCPRQSDMPFVASARPRGTRDSCSARQVWCSEDSEEGMQSCKASAM
jgi:ATP-dependent RNA helicase DHX57